MKCKLLRVTSFLLVSTFITLNIFKFNVKASEIYINARAAIAMDAKTKIVLYEKDAHMVIPMASTTKVMTALVAIKYGNLDRKIKISDRAASIHGSTVGYKKDELISMRELIYGLMLRSGNDAAIAIAEGIAGSVEDFIKLMNEFSSQIGLCSTHFESPHGLDSENHYTTAYDLALITARARENKIFNDIVQTKDIDGKEYGFTRSFHNINKILWQLPNATGVKTGYTGNAGKCLVTSVDINNNDVVIVVLNSPTRWKETQKINKYVSENYDYKNFFSKGEIVDEINIKDMRSPIKLAVTDDIVIPVKKDIDYETKVTKPNYKIEAPIKKGTQIGSISIYANDKKIFNMPLEVNNDVKRKRIFEKWNLFR